MTHYETLGVSETATPDEIKKAYRKLASQHHPDKGGDTARFQAIQTAYDTLSDPNRRQQYDLERRGGGMPSGFNFQWNGPGSHPDLDQIFQNFGFNFGGQSPFQRQMRRNKDLRVNIPVSLASTLSEQNTTISVQTTNGQRETVEVRIPRGVHHGTQIKYPNLGDNLFSTIPRGDLYVHISVAPLDNFVVQDIDLYSKISVNCLLAIAGGTTTITTIDDKIFEITIPPGTQPGIKFRIPGQGLYQLNSNTRGNLYAELNLFVPKDLNSEQLETVRSLINPK
jgi:DnaJ-class molecular chaperone